MGLCLRSATPPDLSAVTRLAGAEPGASWSEAQLARYCGGMQEGQGAADRCLVAEREGRLLGCVLSRQVLDEAEIINVVVAEEARRRGLGRALLRAALAQLQAQGVLHCHLEVRASNAVAAQLYRSEGFLETGRRPGYYRLSDGSTEDALLMTTSLSGRNA